MRSIAIWMLTLIFTVAVAQAQKDLNEKSSLLWRIENAEGASSYLFGTYHLVGSEYLKSHPKVEKAFTGASRVVVEIVTDSSAMMSMALRGSMPGKSLRTLVDSSDYELLKQNIEPVIGYDLMLLDQMKPAMVSTLYAVTLAQQSTPEDFRYNGTPIDLYFAEHGRSTGKTVRALETIEEQAALLFDSESVEEQADQLVEMARAHEEMKVLTRKMLEAYRDERLREMWKQNLSIGDAFGDMELLVNQRNKNWIAPLKEVLAEGGAFIAVGALHLPGQEGLLALLEAAGYTVTAIY